MKAALPLHNVGIALRGDASVRRSTGGGKRDIRFRHTIKARGTSAGTGPAATTLPRRLTQHLRRANLNRQLQPLPPFVPGTVVVGKVPVPNAVQSEQHRCGGHSAITVTDDC